MRKIYSKKKKKLPSRVIIFSSHAPGSNFWPKKKKKSGREISKKFLTTSSNRGSKVRSSCYKKALVAQFISSRVINEGPRFFPSRPRLNFQGRLINRSCFSTLLKSTQNFLSSCACTYNPSNRVPYF